MAKFRRKTLRRMSPTTRKIARLLGELHSVELRLTNLMPDIQRMESDSQALFNRKEFESEAKPTQDTIFEN